MKSYLKDLTQSIGRYGGFLLGAKNFANMGGKGKLNMLDDPRQYNFSDIGKHNPLSCLPYPPSTFYHIIF